MRVEKKMMEMILLEGEVLHDGMSMKWGQLASPARQHGLRSSVLAFSLSGPNAVNSDKIRFLWHGM